MLVSHKYPIHPWVPNTLSHLGAVLAGGLPALQLEPRDDPHLDSAVARGAHVDHQAPSGLEAEAPGSASSTARPWPFHSPQRPSPCHPSRLQQPAPFPDPHLECCGGRRRSAWEGAGAVGEGTDLSACSDIRALLGSRNDRVSGVRAGRWVLDSGPLEHPHAWEAPGAAGSNVGMGLPGSFHFQFGMAEQPPLPPSSPCRRRRPLTAMMVPLSTQASTGSARERRAERKGVEHSGRDWHTGPSLQGPLLPVPPLSPPRPRHRGSHCHCARQAHCTRPARSENLQAASTQ